MAKKQIGNADSMVVRGAKIFAQGVEKAHDALDIIHNQRTRSGSLCERVYARAQAGDSFQCIADDVNANSPLYSPLTAAHVEGMALGFEASRSRVPLSKTDTNRKVKALRAKNISGATEGA
jgi:hypothetical protein